MVRNLLVCAAAVAFVTVGCESVTPVTVTQPADNSAGFAITRLDGLGKDAIENAMAVVDTIAYNLDTIKASRDYYFLVSNAGTIDITDISITVDNSAFTVSPGGVSVLRASSANPELGAIIRLTAVHGVALDGVGYTSPMPSGMNTCGVSLVGLRRGSGGDLEEVRAVVRVSVFAKLVDIDIRDQDRLLTLGENHTYANCSEGGIGWVRMYHVSTTPITVINTGNVPLRISFFNTQLALTPPVTVPVGDSIRPLVSYYNFGSCMVKIESGNTIADYSRLQIGDDGAAYVGVSNNF